MTVGTKQLGGSTIEDSPQNVHVFLEAHVLKLKEMIDVHKQQPLFCQNKIATVEYGKLNSFGNKQKN